MRPVRKTPRLRFGRQSAPNANYFITLCTQDRLRTLTDAVCADSVIETYHQLHSIGDLEMLAATVMPDHLHVLFTLGSRLRLGQVMGKLKSLARRTVRASWHWEQDGFEHQVRRTEQLEDHGFYIFMNPYRAGLCPLAECWPWWFCPCPIRFRFLEGLGDGTPVPAPWLDECKRVSERIWTRRRE